MGHHTQHFIERAYQRIGIVGSESATLARKIAEAIRDGDEAWCRFQAQHRRGSKIYRIDIPQGRFWIVVLTAGLVCITVLTADQPIAVRRKGRMRKTLSGGSNGTKGMGVRR